MTAPLRPDELTALRERDAQYSQIAGQHIEILTGVDAMYDRHRLLATLDATRATESRLRAALQVLIAGHETGVLYTEDWQVAKMILKASPEAIVAVCKHPAMFRQDDGVCVICGKHESEF